MTVYVIDDHPLMRDALTMLVQRVRPGLKGGVGAQTQQFGIDGRASR